jgi:serine phosphatase RsbU (regulator of sigma subunit)
MSGGGFHVHGPHDHELEHAAHSGDDFASKIAVMTAILSTVGALFSYQGGATQNESLIYKNEAAIRKTEASNQWNYYQAKSNKQNLAELSVVVTSGETADKYRKEIERYKKEKEEIKVEAEKLEAAAKAADEKSEHALHVHHRWAQAMTLVQIAISLAAITLLTRKTWLKFGAWGAAGAGVVLGVMAALGA